MIRDTWIHRLPWPPNGSIIIVKVTKGVIRGAWEAQRVINALRTKLPLEDIGLEVVVMDGEPIERPALSGNSPDAEAFVRNIMPELATGRWQLTKLDW